MASDKKAIGSVSLHEYLELSILRPAVIEQLRKWVDNSTSISVLVSGKTGTGKSTLINGIIGKCVTKEGHKLSRETSQVNKHQLKVQEVNVNIFDTPGLEDKTQQDATYTEEMQKVCNDVDLFLYCIKMSEMRFFEGCDDAIAMNRLTKALGDQLWVNGMFVLTFANDLVSMAEDRDENVPEYFQKKYVQMAKELRAFLQDIVKLPAGIVTNVPIVCAGCAKKPKLPSIAPEHLEASVHTDTHWLSFLWIKALRRTKPSAQPAMIKVNLHRLSENKEYSIEEMRDSTCEIIEMQPIMLGQQGAEIMKGLGEGGEKIGKVIGEDAGRRSGEHIALAYNLNLLLSLLIDLTSNLLD